MENIPFEAGQLTEERSFATGFRGAWFRCKIKDIAKRKEEPYALLESCDYMDDKPRWAKICQIPPHARGNKKKKCREFILRPQYPRIYNEKQVPHVNEISDVIVIVCDSWKVGDLVDCMHSGCFWSGNITEVFDDQEAQVELRPPPRGEGGSYRIPFKDLRPSLDWSLECGWTLPTQEDGTGNPCARLIKPINQVIDTMVRVADACDAGDEDVPQSGGLHGGLLFSSRDSSNLATSSEVKSTSKIGMKKCVEGTTLSKEQKNHLEKNASHGCEDNNIKDIDSRQSTTGKEVASSEVKSTSKVEMKKCVRGATLLKEQENDMEKDASHGCEDKERTQLNMISSTIGKEPAVVVDDMNRKRCMAREGDTLNSKRSNTIEATVLDLEEFINKVKWLKEILQDGISSSENKRPQWKFA